MEGNRFTPVIAKITKSLEGVDVDLAKTEATLALSFDEWFRYQDLQAGAHAAGLLSTEEAQAIYQALGVMHHQGNGGWASGVTLAEKIVYTKVIAELLKGVVASG